MEDRSLRSRSKRLLALALVAACAGFAACGDDEAPPDTEVIVPEQTAAPESSDATALPSADGILVRVTQRRIALRTIEGDAVFFVAAADRPALGIEHMQSHMGVPSIGFRIYYERRGEKYFARAAEEIPAPF
jgi:hypothetical protein